MKLPDLYEEKYWLVVFNLFVLTVGVGFFVSTITGNMPMDPGVYGPSIYIIPAEAWSLSIICLSLGTAIGFVVKGRSGAILIAASSFGSVIIYMAFFVMSLQAEHGTILSLFSGLMFSPMHSLVMLSAMIEAMKHDRQPK